jgi:hypothetical protein
MGPILVGNLARVRQEFTSPFVHQPADEDPIRIDFIEISSGPGDCGFCATVPFPYRVVRSARSVVKDRL